MIHADRGETDSLRLIDNTMLTTVSQRKTCKLTAMIEPNFEISVPSNQKNHFIDFVSLQEQIGAERKVSTSFGLAVT